MRSVFFSEYALRSTSVFFIEANWLSIVRFTKVLKTILLCDNNLNECATYALESES